MFERFTDRSRKVMQLANQEAQRFRHEYIGTEHILLGLVQEASGVAANVLKNLNIDLHKIQSELRKIIQHGPGGEQVVMGRLPHTPRAKKVIEFAIEEARLLNHSYIGTEHLLLGLLREQDAVAAQVLMNLGLNLDDAREEVLNMLGHNAAEPPPPPRPPEGRSVTAFIGVRGDISRLTEEQFGVAQGLVRRLLEERDAFVAAQDFEQAARRRSEAEALMALISWYVRVVGQ